MTDQSDSRRTKSQKTTVEEMAESATMAEILSVKMLLARPLL